MDAELTVVEKREYRARDQRPERLTPKDSCWFAVRGSSVGILVKKSHRYESPLFVFPQSVCLTGQKQTREGKSALPEDTVQVFWRFHPGV